MLDDVFSAEVRVANALRIYLLSERKTIIQLVTSGAQAPYSITYTDSEGHRKTIFPDLLCWDGQAAYVGEIKPSFSQQDRDKLIALMNSNDGEIRVRHLLNRTGCPEAKTLLLKFVLIFAGMPTPEAYPLSQLVLTRAGFTWF
jgi:hypothetical protein